MNNEEQRIQESTKQALDISLSSIDESTQILLQQSRKQALERANRSSVWQSVFKPLPIASALAFSFALLISLPQWQANPDTDKTTWLAEQQAFDDLLLLSDVDDDTLELIEDLEFALWLTEEMDTPSEDLKLETQAETKTPATRSDTIFFLSMADTHIGCTHA